MKAIVNTGPNQLEWRELPRPEPGAGQVRIRTGACGICATDLEMIAGWPRTGFPAIPGHEWSGTVDAIGPGADRSLVGRRCVAENVWSAGGEVGFEHPGGYAEYLLTEVKNVRVLPEGFLFAAAAMIEPLAVSVRGMNRLGRFEVDRPVLIFGDGPIGLVMAMLMSRAGARDITLVGGREHRLKLAREFGAPNTINYHREAPTMKGISTVIEASGSAKAYVTIFKVIAPRAKILVLSDYGAARADFPWNTILHGELELIGSNASGGAWDEAVRLAVENKLPLDRLVSHRVPAAEFSRGMAIMKDREANAVKVVMEW